MKLENHFSPSVPNNQNRTKHFNIHSEDWFIIVILHRDDVFERISVTRVVTPDTPKRIRAPSQFNKNYIKKKNVNISFGHV